MPPFLNEKIVNYAVIYAFVTALREAGVPIHPRVDVGDHGVHIHFHTNCVILSLQWGRSALATRNYADPGRLQVEAAAWNTARNNERVIPPGHSEVMPYLAWANTEEVVAFARFLSVQKDRDT